MRYDELRWEFDQDDHHTSQRLRPIRTNSSPIKYLPRVYVKKWEYNRFSMVWVYPRINFRSNKLEYNLDLADVAVRLLRLMEDERVHKYLTTLDPE